MLCLVALFLCILGVFMLSQFSLLSLACALLFCARRSPMLAGTLGSFRCLSIVARIGMGCCGYVRFDHSPSPPHIPSRACALIFSPRSVPPPQISSLLESVHSPLLHHSTAFFFLPRLMMIPYAEQHCFFGVCVHLCSRACCWALAFGSSAL